MDSELRVIEEAITKLPINAAAPLTVALSELQKLSTFSQREQALRALLLQAVALVEGTPEYRLFDAISGAIFELKDVSPTP